MPADLARLPTGSDSWAMLVDHALSLGDLSEVDYLELKSTLPFAERADRRRSGAMLARQVLGMRNRMPDVAQTHLGGHGVVFVGISGGQVTGAEQVDGTVLHDVIYPFLGDAGPRWDYQYIAHPAGLVLAVIVDPPRWGDPMYACVKTFGDSDQATKLRDGDVYVRVHGATRLATSADLADLARRQLQDPTTGAAITVAYDGSFDRIDSTSAITLVEQLIERQADGLLDALPSNNTHPAVAAVAKMRLDQRSPEQFRQQVEGWRAAATRRAPSVATEFLRHELSKGRLSVANGSDRYLERVQVEVQFPADVEVLAASDTRYCHHGGQFDFSSLLPKAPDAWNTFDAGALLRDISSPSRISTAPPPDVDIEVERTPLGSLVRWHLDDLRPRAREVSSETIVVFTDGHVDEIEVRWRATARAVDHVFNGLLTIACAQAPFEHLTYTAATS